MLRLKSIHIQSKSLTCLVRYLYILRVNTLQLTQSGHHFGSDMKIFKLMLLNKSCCILIKISQKFVPKDSVNAIISSDNGMATNKQQAIISVNGPVSWHIYASLSLSVSTHLPFDEMATIFHTIFRSIFVNEKFCILIKISLKFVPKGPIDNNPVLY